MVRVEADPWPFDDRWRPAAEVAPAADGRCDPRAPHAQHALPGRRHGARQRARRGLRAARRAFSRRELARTALPRAGSRSPGRAAAAARAPGALLRRARPVAGSRAPGLLTAAPCGARRPCPAATLRYRTSRRTTVVLACYREAPPDPWGRADPIDPHCGAKRLRLARARARGLLRPARLGHRPGLPRPRPSGSPRRALPGRSDRSAAQAGGPPRIEVHHGARARGRTRCRRDRERPAARPARTARGWPARAPARPAWPSRRPIPAGPCPSCTAR